MDNALAGFAKEDIHGKLSLDALAEQLHEAIKAREDARAELEKGKLESQKVVDSLVDELDTVIKYRDKTIEEITQIKEEQTARVESLATERDAAIQERDKTLADLASAKADLDHQLKKLADEARRSRLQGKKRSCATRTCRRANRPGARALRKKTNPRGGRAQAKLAAATQSQIGRAGKRSA